MLENFMLEIKYAVDGIEFTTDCDNEHVTLVQNISSKKFYINLIPLSGVELLSVKAVFNYEFSRKDRLFLNGYQSWSRCEEYDLSDKQKKSENDKSLTGDCHFYDYSEKAGVFHGYTYAYIKNPQQNKYELIASLQEDTGFTRIKFDTRQNEIIIEREVKNVVVYGIYNLFNIYYYSGENLDGLFDAYFEMMELQKPKNTNIMGYTTKYCNKLEFSEKAIENDVKQVCSILNKLDLYLLGMGYEKAIGDWVMPAEKFPNGLGKIVDEIHKNNKKAGLWVAPFLVEGKSRLYNMHSSWLVKKDNQLVNVGEAGKELYVLDIYNPKAKEYLEGVFDTIFSNWGFDAVYLDYLYVQAITARYDFSRGQIMSDAMKFLREVCRDKLIFAGGVPLGSAFGNVDACEICCNVGAGWLAEDKIEDIEDSSAGSAINTMAFRQYLNGRAFIGFADAMFTSENKNYEVEEAKGLKVAQNVFCGAKFASEDSKALDEFNAVSVGYDVLELEKIGNKIHAKVKHNDEIKELSINIKNGEVKLS